MTQMEALKLLCEFSVEAIDTEEDHDQLKEAEKTLRSALGGEREYRIIGKHGDIPTGPISIERAMKGRTSQDVIQYRVCSPWVEVDNG